MAPVPAPRSTSAHGQCHCPPPIIAGSPWPIGGWDIRVWPMRGPQRWSDASTAHERLPTPFLPHHIAHCCYHLPATRHLPRPHVTCNLMCLLIFCRAVIKMIYWRHWNTRLLHTPRVPDDNQRSSTSVQNLSKAMLSWWCCCLVPTPVTVPGQGGDDVWATELWGMTTDQWPGHTLGRRHMTLSF